MITIGRGKRVELRSVVSIYAVCAYLRRCCWVESPYQTADYSWHMLGILRAWHGMSRRCSCIHFLLEHFFLST